MSVKRAYSVFKATDVDEEKWEITGIASTPAVDRDGDIVEPEGALFDLPLPLLWQHDSAKPIGQVVKARATKNGIPVTVRITKPEDDTPPGLRARLQEAWSSVKMQLVRGFSIGFKPVETARIEGTYGYRFIKWMWLELSLVTIPANQEATITSIKSADEAVRRALKGTDARNAPVSLATPAGVPATSSSSITMKGTPTMGLKEMLQAAEAKRAAAVARMNALMKLASDETRTLTDEEGAEYDALQAECDQVDKHITRLKGLAGQPQEKATVPNPNLGAAPGTDLVTAGAGTDAASIAAAARGAVTNFGQGLRLQSNLPQGTGFTRFAICMAKSRGSMSDALIHASRYKDTPEVALAIKAASDPGNTTDSTWAAPIAELQIMSQEFIALLRPMSIIGRLAGFRNVPFNVKIPRQTGGSTVGWVGQSAPKPVGELAFDSLSLGISKIAGIIVISQELARLSNPAAEGVIRQDMLEVIAAYSDQQFIDPAVAISANVSPASVTNGVSPRVSTGRTVAAVTADAEFVMNAMSVGNLNFANAYWVMNARTALFLSMLRTTQDLFAFPGITIAGGTWMGLPVIVSNNVPLSSPTGDSTIIALVNTGEILMADDGNVNIDVSTEASLQMNTTPSAGAQSLVSLWQNNLIGVRAERFINYLKRRSQAVQYISEVQY